MKKKKSSLKLINKNNKIHNKVNKKIKKNKKNDIKTLFNKYIFFT